METRVGGWQTLLTTVPRTLHFFNSCVYLAAIRQWGYLLSAAACYRTGSEYRILVL